MVEYISWLAFRQSNDRTDKFFIVTWQCENTMTLQLVNERDSNNQISTRYINLINVSHILHCKYKILNILLIKINQYSFITTVIFIWVKGYCYFIIFIILWQTLINL